MYECWLAGIEKISVRKKILLHKYMKSAKNAYHIEETHLNKLLFLNETERNTIRQAQKNQRPEEEYEKLLKKQIRLITCFDSDYPKRLLQIEDKPYGLYVKGKLPGEEAKSAALVGARHCTAYGEKQAFTFAETLASYGVQIISGLARGIDGIGQRGALSGRGKTFAVLGCGVDICYPREHIGLYMDILENEGGIFSEFPPGVPPMPYHFPQRNRLISGLSDVVLVMEAKEKSGSLITADIALEQGKDVYALPGPVDSAQSAGCNQLIRQGAGILLSAEMLMEELGIARVQRRRKPEVVKKKLESEENMVYSAIAVYPKSAGQSVEETGLLASVVRGILVSLEMGGYIKEISKNYYIRS